MSTSGDTLTMMCSGPFAMGPGQGLSRGASGNGGSASRPNSRGGMSMDPQASPPPALISASSPHRYAIPEDFHRQLPHPNGNSQGNGCPPPNPDWQMLSPDPRATMSPSSFPMPVGLPPRPPGANCTPAQRPAAGAQSYAPPQQLQQQQLPLGMMGRAPSPGTSPFNLSVAVAAGGSSSGPRPFSSSTTGATAGGSSAALHEHGSSGGGGSSGRGSPAPSGAATPGAGSGGGIGQGVYLVVDPATGRVVGTAQATSGASGASTPSSFAFATPPGGLGIGGTTPMTGSNPSSARASFDMPQPPAAAAAAAAILNAAAAAAQQRQRPAPSVAAPAGPADLASATLSLLTSPAGSVVGGGQQGSSLPGAHGAGGMPAAAGQVSGAALRALAEQLGLSGVTQVTPGGEGSLPPPGIAEQLQQQQQQQQQRAAAAASGDGSVVDAVRQLDPVTAWQVLQEGLTAGNLPDDFIMALAQAAGIMDPSSGAINPDAAAMMAAAGAPPPSGAFHSALLGTTASPAPHVTAAGMPYVSPGPMTHVPMTSAMAQLPAGTGTPGAGRAGGFGSVPGTPGSMLSGLTSPRGPMGLLAGITSPSAGSNMGTGPKHNSLYKTELCRSWNETGSCRYGSKCQFAHGQEELRHVMRHPKYKTEVCRTFATTGTCHYGVRCRFIHVSPGGGISLPMASPAATPSQRAAAAAAAFGMASPAAGGPMGRSVLVGQAEQQQQGGAEDAALGLWSPGNRALALPAAAAALLSPTGRGPMRHSLSLASPPHKMQRMTTTTAAAAGGGGASAPSLAQHGVSASLSLLSPGRSAGSVATSTLGMTNGIGWGGSGAHGTTMSLFNAFGGPAGSAPGSNMGSEGEMSPTAYAALSSPCVFGQAPHSSSDGAGAGAGAGGAEGGSGGGYL